jgi:hypothetical protein
MKLFTGIAFLLLSFFGQGQIAIDTAELEIGKVVLYSDQTWQIVEDKDFDGVLNPRIHDIMNSEEMGVHTLTWNTHDCYSRNNDLTKLRDTVWLCVQSEELGGFTMPFDGVVTSRYKYRNGKFHNGIDIDLVTGDTVVCAWDGVVRYAESNSGGYGNLVIVRHYNGLETYYAHLSKLLTFSGQKVKSGDVLGLGGNTGHSFGSHLHFEVRFYDNTINPEEVIDFKKKELKSSNLFLHKTLFRPGVTPSSQWKTNSTGKKQYVEKKYYKVRSGDTLSRIAEKHRTSINRLCNLNGIRSTSILQIGQNIRVR